MSSACVAFMHSMTNFSKVYRESKLSLSWHHGDASYQKFLNQSEIINIHGNKIRPIPNFLYALFYNVCCRGLDLSKLVFNEPTMRSAEGLKFCAFVFARELQQTFSWLVTIFSKPYGAFIREDSRFQIECYRKWKERVLIPKMFFDESKSAVVPHSAISEFNEQNPANLWEPDLEIGKMIRFGLDRKNRDEFSNQVKDVLHTQKPLFTSEQGRKEILASVDQYFSQLATLIANSLALESLTTDERLTGKAKYTLSYQSTLQENQESVADVASLRSDGKKSIPVLVHADGTQGSAQVIVDTILNSNEWNVFMNVASTIPRVKLESIAIRLLKMLCIGSKALYDKLMQGKLHSSVATSILIGMLVPSDEDHLGMFITSGNCQALQWHEDGRVKLLGADNIHTSPVGQIGIHSGVLPKANLIKIFTTTIEEGDRIITLSNTALEALLPDCYYKTPFEAYDDLSEGAKAELGISNTTLKEWEEENAWFTSSPELIKLKEFYIVVNAEELLENCRTEDAKGKIVGRCEEFIGQLEKREDLNKESINIWGEKNKLYRYKQKNGLNVHPGPVKVQVIDPSKM